jgi:hypothetical protein
VAGVVAILAVLAGILLVNLLNSPSDHGPVSGSASRPGASATPAPTGATSSGPASGRPTASTSPRSTHAATTPAPRPSAGRSAAPSGPPRVFAPVVIFNDSRISRLADAAVAPVEAAGFRVERVGNYNSTYNVPATTVFYDAGDEAAARTMLATVPGVQRMVPRSQTRILQTGTLILVVTRDFPTEPSN